ncbi:type II CAAX prenyl endopeptidase Rce1 family protein [Clostridioides sp. ES-S-0077-01]|uniref:CPBP family glutamic-type intramembrane protease n=1 Tax=Clostridioides sp. ES-S-0077-01 TaxID=2770782 RepID=UPI001D12C678|nr:CPBP family intramembrane metalloprotease [Clostridioides sp. ES-S-0056-01]MCC0713871.1 CPBP family intramembrane metalloprotease [Clostridioides sp. ES-S-0077-01]
MQLYNTPFNTNKHLIYFFTFTILLNWIFSLIPVLLGITNTILGEIIFYLAYTSPAIVGLFFISTIYPQNAKQDFIYRYLSFKKMGIKWSLLTILFFSLTFIISLIIGNYFNVKTSGIDWGYIAIFRPSQITYMLFASFILSILSQEAGWRGYAIDKLLVRFGFIGSSMILGLICGIWYLGSYFTPNQMPYNLAQYSLFDAFLFIPSIILLNFIINFVYINTNRSILAAGFTHMIHNFFNVQLLLHCPIKLCIIAQYVQIIFGLIFLTYMISSNKFKQKVNSEIEQIKLDDFEFELDWQF